MSQRTGDGVFDIDEDPLRQWILKAYHEKRGGSESEREVLEAIREFLSGPADGLGSPRYRFEDASEPSILAFAEKLEKACEGCVDSLLDPLLQGLEPEALEMGTADAAKSSSPDLAPNLSVYIAFLAGSIALKTKLDETLVCALLSTWLLALAKLGQHEVERILGRSS